MNSIVQFDSSNWGVLKEQANILLKSGFLPSSIRTAENALAIMMLGQELGIGAWASLSSINVIQNRPTVSPQLMLALINRSGQLDDITIDSTDQGCTVVMTRKGRTPHTETFNLANVQAMQLSGKDNYRKQPATMMKWRAVAACARVVFADVILGLYTPEEMGADVVVDDQGNMKVIETPQPPPAPPAIVTRETPSNFPQLKDFEDELPPFGVDGSSALQPDPVTDPKPVTEPTLKVVPTDTSKTADSANSPLPAPQIGALNMNKLYADVIKLGLMKGGERPHFDNLIRKLQADGSLRDAMSLHQATEAIRAHYDSKAVEEAFTAGEAGSVEP